MPFIESEAGRAFYALAGGPQTAAPAVLIHGAGGSHLDWPPALRRLPGRRTLALDLPGHGRSDPPGRDSIADYAEWALTFLDAALPDSPPVFLIGHSMGSAIALQIARRAPKRLAGLILIAAGARLPLSPALLAAPEPAAALVEMAYGPGAPAGLRRLGLARLALLEPATLLGDLRACAGFYLRGRLGEAPAPALIIIGREDRLTPPALAEELRAGLPRAELRIIEGAGHMVTFEAGEAVLAAVEAFLSDQVSRW